MNKKALVGILILAAVLRFWNLGSGDPLSDEILYAFRSVGMLDFDNAAHQTTPLEWTDPDIPAWTELSFHDHPPLVFWVQNLFMKIFGENTFAFRLPSAIFGVLAVYLLYLIGWRLFTEKIGLAAAAILAVTINSVFISRVGLQESYVIFFILLAFYFFLRALDKEKYFVWVGIALGLGFLAKYTAFILAPAFLVYLVIFRREIFKKRFFWLGIFISLAIFSPVIIYNIQLYKSVGHFDFQISYLFGQQPEVWKVAPGKEEIGSLADRLRNFLPNLFSANSWLFLTAALLSFLGIGAMSYRTILRPNLFFIFLILGFHFILFLIIGPQLRFLSMATPWLVLMLAAGFWLIQERFFKSRKVFIAAALLFLVGESAYTLNSQFFNKPFGLEFWDFSKVHYENYDWGYNTLGDYLEQELRNKMPAFTFDLKYKFLEDARNRNLEQARRKKFIPYPAMIIYDGNVHNAAQAWYLDRLQIYHGWPVMKAQEYLDFLNKEGEDYFRRAGLENAYLIIPTEKLPLKRLDQLTNFGAVVEQELLKKGIYPLLLYNGSNEGVLRVYKFRF